MLKHYIKVAFRNLWKYKTQSLISIIGLAVGFTCFALASLWLRYETTYDAFHKNAKDIYYFNRDFYFSVGDLRKDYPEIKEVAIMESLPPFPAGGINVAVLYTQRSALNMFDIQVLDGQFPEPNENSVAITAERAALLFGKENPIGKTIKITGEHTISAVVSGYDHTNFPFDVIIPVGTEGTGARMMGSDFVMLHPDVDFKAFHQKLRDRISQQYKDNDKKAPTDPIFIPLTEFRYKDPLHRRSIKFEYIGLFALIGILVIVCSLFNYITLFVARFRIRSKEFALRFVCGSSRNSLISLLTAEYLISLILSSFLGLLLVKILSPTFEELSEIQVGLSGIYGELLLYFLVVLIVSLVAFWLAIALLGKSTLQGAIQKNNKQVFRKFSVVAQLFITIAMIFCSVVMIKQMHFLHDSSNIGFEVKNLARISVYGGSMGETMFPSFSLEDQLKQIPEIEEVISGYAPLIPDTPGAMNTKRVSDWDDQADDDKSIMLKQFITSDEYIRFYNLQLVEGELAGWEDSPESVLINESAAKAFGWDDALGKHFILEHMGAPMDMGNGKFQSTFGSPTNHRVVGVLKNIYNVSTTAEVDPTIYVSDKHSQKRGSRAVLIKYKEGSWKIVLDKIKKIEEKYIPDGGFIRIHNSEEEYDEQFKSETSLILILNFVSLVCVLVSVFGFFSLIALNLEERRKEMAIRKVNGATPKNIVSVYFKEYFSLLLISSLLAFPVAYIIMKRWLEQYIQQTEISVWIYVAILFVIAVVIALSTGWRIWRSSRENPVETLKMS
ncbi:FtsX-like permease family protein [Bacteroidales bacterium OttesenSCG-928-A17]|nr:FtsX-like permease family protein [Bacteroidales bacterium OttesenSCG-928-A17]